MRSSVDAALRRTSQFFSFEMTASDPTVSRCPFTPRVAAA